MNTSTEISQLWNKLDNLYKTDPSKYREFISQVETEAKESLPDFKVTPIECRKHTIKNNQGILFINLCSSEKVSAPTTWTNGTVDIVVDELRALNSSIFEETKESVVDVIVHPNVIEKSKTDIHLGIEIDNLIVDTVERALQLRLSRAKTNYEKPYIGHFKWNPMEIALQQVNNVLIDGTDTLQEPIDILRINQKETEKEEILQPLMPTVKKGIIIEETPFSIKETETVFKILIDTNNPNAISLRYKDSKVHFNVKEREYEIKIPFEIINPVAKYDKRKEILVVKLERK